MDDLDYITREVFLALLCDPNSLARFSQCVLNTEEDEGQRRRYEEEIRCLMDRRFRVARRAADLFVGLKRSEAGAERSEAGATERAAVSAAVDLKMWTGPGWDRVRAAGERMQKQTMNDLPLPLPSPENGAEEEDPH